ncbi:MAG TPA: amino acid adenylation domain-containing protein, partial [Verrucomicrobiae bacterium]|nr:amino acid adenylation domain-containing protein [Verrucomicrobiae bacterium]
QEVNRPFDLNICPLLRAVLFRSSDTEHVLVTTIHHLVADEWSVRIIFNELGKLYAAHAKNEPVVMPAPGIQYADYAVWQRGALQGEALERQLSFWKQTLAGSPPLLELTPGHPRGLKPTFNGAVIRRSLGKDLLDEMKQLARKERATPFMVLLAAFQSLTHRYTGQDDLVIATPQAGRNQVETEGVVGFFVNTLLLRVSLQGNPTFREILERARRATLAAFEHQETPLQKIVEVAQPERSTHHLPFTRLMFLTQTSLMEKMRWADLDVEFLDVATDTAKFDLTFGLQETSEGLIARAEFNTDLFPRETVEKLLEHFEILLRGAVRQPDARVSELPLLSEAERQRILFEGNLTAATYPRDCAVHEIFQRQARSQPGGAALRFGDRVLSYAGLNERANQLARHLARSESARGGHIAFCLPPSPEMIIAMLGILKAGAAYVPLDPGYPPERLRFMLEDSAAAALITEERLLSVFGGTRAKTICLDRDRASIEAESGADPEIPIRGGDAAYLMYTSGSTGVPKGVVVPHRAINRLVLNTNYISFRSDDRVAQVSNVSFDAATFEVWGALLNGACLVGIPTETLLSPPDFARELRDLKITTMFLTSAVFNQIAAEAPDAFSRLRTLVAGGEALDAASVRAVLNTSPPARLLNGYGPTENTTFTCWHEIGEVKPGQSSVPIGKPVSNTQVYILDRYLNPVPPGAPGELYAAGDGLAIGYWNSPELNRERFIPNPFGGHEQERLYKTGDLARRLPSGEIEFLGRVDNQVKLRGFRIELGEVEAALKEHPSVRECVVKIFGGAADKKRLAAYLSPRDGQTADSAALRDFLRGRLPEYMIPSSFTVLDALPLTQNGKVDRAALPEPDQIRLGKERVSPPRDDVELKLARIWEAVLGVSPIGIQDRFFDLGGHSLLAVRVISQTEKVFGRKLKLATIFQAQTIAELAAVLREEIKESAVVHSSSVVQIQPRGSRTPLFLVHGAGGGMFWGYMNLSRHLGLDQPVFAIRSRALDGRDEFETIEEMAESYIKDLKTVQPSGPYLLGGYCFGGNVAYEMARLLEQRGEKSLLLLLNAAPPNSSYTNFRMTAGWWGRFAKNLLYWGNYVRHWTPSQRREFFRWKRERFAAKLGLLRRPASAASKVDVGDMVDLSLFSPEERKAWEAHIRALLLYHPGKFQGAVNLIRSPGHPMWCSFSPDYGWGPLAKGGVQVTIVPGAHEKILEEPCVKTVAAELQKFLEGARELSAEQIVSKPQNTVAPEAVEPPTRADAVEFWQKQLAGAPALLELPTDFNRPAVQSGSISAKSFRLPASFSARLKSFAKAAGTATEIPLIASVAILLRRYSRQEDFVMGFENSSRASSASPGETVSTPQPPLVLRQRVNGSAVTRDLLAGLNEQFAEAEKHRLFSVKELMDLLDPTEDASYQPIFQVLLSTGDAHSHRETSRFDLEFHVIRSDETLELEILYSRDLFEEATVARMLRHWETLLGGILERPERNVSELPILPPEEQKLLLEDWTATDREYPRDQTLATLIFEQAQRSPDAIAIVDGTIRLTYGEMHRRAVALAASLRSLGVGQETLVGICVHRSWRMIVGILGTLYAGGAYVPLDPAYPQDRLKYILEDARAEVLITEEK